MGALKQSFMPLALAAGVAASSLLSATYAQAADAAPSTNSTTRAKTTLVASSSPAAASRTNAPATLVKKPGSVEEDAQIRAGTYSLNSKGVGIAVFKGSGSKIPGEDVGNTLGKMMREYGVDSKVFVDNREFAHGTGVIFVIKGTPLGPYSLKESLVEVGRIARYCKGAHFEDKTVSAINNNDTLVAER